MKFLYLIPARGGSKGIPGKNLKHLNNKRLIGYSIDVARAVTTDNNICITSDSSDIIDVVTNEYQLNVPFKRPDSLATDKSGMYEVMLHAIEHYENLGQFYDALVLLQPTSPFRTSEHLEAALKLYSNDIDMVLSVFETASNPYYLLLEENDDGFLRKSKEGTFQRRQDIPPVYEINGAIYVINIKRLKEKLYASISEFPKIIKYIMPTLNSLDLDTPLDWEIAELLLKTGKL
jgi:N-acylneuraminate cytidylyltransferase